MSPHGSERPASALSQEARDELEFQQFAQQQDPLDLEAAHWVARHVDGLDANGRAELTRWLDADLRHQSAFDRLAVAFGDVRRLRGERARLAAPVPPTAAPLSDHLRQPDPPRRSLRAPRFAFATLMLALLVGSLLWYEGGLQHPRFDQHYETARGQQLTVRLPDDGAEGSTLVLDTGTRLHARVFRDRREVVLQTGQALFTVRPDTQRPFVVLAGPLRITVVGTRFSVRHTADGLDAERTVVSVEEGRVRVVPIDGSAGTDHGPEAAAAAAAGERPLELQAGQAVTADGSRGLGPVTSLPLAAAAAWREGRLSFDQTPLAQALAEFERYGPSGIVVRDRAVAALPVGGSYGVAQVQRFVDSLPQTLPVRLVRRGEVLEVVAR